MSSLTTSEKPVASVRKRGRPRINTPKSEALRVRLYEEEKIAFDALAASLDVSTSELLRRMVREAVGTGPSLFDDGIGGLVDAGNAVGAVGRNVNQITRAINAGRVNMGPKGEDEIRQLAAVLLTLKKEIRRLIAKSKNRRIKFSGSARNGS